MTEFKKIFLDIAPLIFFLYEDMKFEEKVKNIRVENFLKF